MRSAAAPRKRGRPTRAATAAAAAAAPASASAAASRSRASTAASAASASVEPMEDEDGASAASAAQPAAAASSAAAAASSRPSRAAAKAASQRMHQEFEVEAKGENQDEARAESESEAQSEEESDAESEEDQESDQEESEEDEAGGDEDGSRAMSDAEPAEEEKESNGAASAAPAAKARPPLKKRPRAAETEDDSNGESEDSDDEYTPHKKKKSKRAAKAKAKRAAEKKSQKQRRAAAEEEGSSDFEADGVPEVHDEPIKIELAEAVEACSKDQLSKKGWFLAAVLHVPEQFNLNRRSSTTGNTLAQVFVQVYCSSYLKELRVKHRSAFVKLAKDQLNFRLRNKQGQNLVHTLVSKETYRNPDYDPSVHAKGWAKRKEFINYSTRLSTSLLQLATTKDLRCWRADDRNPDTLIQLMQRVNDDLLQFRDVVRVLDKATRSPRTRIDVDLSARDERGRTFLHLLARRAPIEYPWRERPPSRRLAVIALIMSTPHLLQQIDLNACDDSGESTLQAIQREHDAVSAFLQQYPQRRWTHGTTEQLRAKYKDLPHRFEAAWLTARVLPLAKAALAPILCADLVNFTCEFIVEPEGGVSCQHSGADELPDADVEGMVGGPARHANGAVAAPAVDAMEMDD